MAPEVSIESLMSRYQEGDPGAACALVTRLSPQLYRFFLSQFVSRAHADDLLQETWMRIHEARHTYRPGEPVLPWFYAIARHIRVDHYRKAQRRATRELPMEESAEPVQPAAADPPGHSDLETLLATLPESQREVVALLKVSGMSLEEVARATSSSVGAVKQKAHRAYEKLRQLLGGAEAPASRKGAAS
ncbi:MAG TPA: sigma-70 family RNA polymerase sigma factor [Verrucomicrobiae bacterium]|nr:sigma-70 family RNA polymerase sigma factor [Verrucomicrobiae bacterium]